MLYMSFMKTEPHSPNKHTTMPKSCFLVSMMKLFLFRVFLLSFIHTISPSLAITNITTDQSALLALKAHITHDPQNLLATNWSTSTSVCNWVGVTCGLRHHRVTVLNVSYFGLTGTIPPHLGNLSFLTELRIRNDNFYGSLPIELTHLRRIKLIDFGFNNFTGEIPSWLGSFSKLQYLHLGGNQFSGIIPKKIGNATMLKSLHLFENHLTEEIPQEIGDIELEALQLSSNTLTGTIPSSIFNMSYLWVLALSNNYLFGMLPDNICHTLPNLEELYLVDCNFRGRISSQLSQCEKLRIFSLAANNLTGLIPSILFNMSHLEIICLSENIFEPTILPENICRNLPNLKELYMDDINLGGNIPSQLLQCGKLRVITLASNNIVGSIPQTVGNLTNLEELYLNNNGLTVRANLEFIKKLGVGHAKYQGKTLVRFGPTDLVCFRTLQDHARKVKKTFLQCEIVGKQFPICHEHFGRRMLHISGSLIPAHTCNIHWLAKHRGDGTVTERVT